MAQKKNNSMTVRLDDLMTFEPMTKTQEKVFESFDEEENLVLTGSAGTGKTFLALYLALEQVLDAKSVWTNIILIRSNVSTRDIGYLPGSAHEKMDMFTAPYRHICNELFGDKNAWGKLTQSSFTISFESTSFIRGQTFEDSIVIVDEMQNLNFHELDSVMTRLGNNSRIIFCGDYLQSDFKNQNDKNGIFKFLNILDNMKHFTCIEFGWEDIVRSGIVRDYIMTKEMLGVE